MSFYYYLLKQQLYLKSCNYQCHVIGIIGIESRNSIQTVILGNIDKPPCHPNQHRWGDNLTCLSPTSRASAFENLDCATGLTSPLLLTWNPDYWSPPMARFRLGRKLIRAGCKMWTNRYLFNFWIWFRYGTAGIGKAAVLDVTWHGSIFTESDSWNCLHSIQFRQGLFVETCIQRIEWQIDSIRFDPVLLLSSTHSFERTIQF